MTREIRSTLEAKGWEPIKGQMLETPSIYVRSKTLNQSEPINWKLSDEESFQILRERVQQVKEYAEIHLANAEPDQWNPK